MVATCAVKGCRNKKDDRTLSFFKLPKEAERRKKWLESIGRLDLAENAKYTSYSVCSAHFHRSSLVRIVRLKEDAMPTEGLPHQASNEISTQTKDSYVKGKIKDSDMKSTTTQETEGSDMNKHTKPYRSRNLAQTLAALSSIDETVTEKDKV